MHNRSKRAARVVPYQKGEGNLFSQQFWYVGALALFVIVLEVFTAKYAAQHRFVARVMLWCAAAFVLVYEIVLFARTRAIPIAFSTFSYFLFGIAVFLPLRPLKSAAAFCSFISGVVYLSSFVLYPDVVYANQPNEAERIVGFLLHNLMLFGSLLLYGQCKVHKTDVFYILGFVAFVVVYTEVAVHVCASEQANFLTVGIIEATLVKQIAPHFAVRWWWYDLWYAFVAVVAWAMWELTCLINNKLVRQ